MCLEFLESRGKEFVPRDIVRMQRACLQRKYNAIIDLLMTENALNGQGSRGAGRGARGGEG